ncbi:MAG: glycosyltransferase [Bacteroidetes bacterium]|nr:MAG: glycosyltransferase [Bacteroidota bacterium]
MSDQKKHILFIASWYPSLSAPALGNFIQQHARAAALHHNVSVVFAHSDAELEQGNFVFETKKDENLFEVRVHFTKTKSKIPLISSWKKAERYRGAMRLGIDEAIDEHGAPDLVHLHVIWPAALAALPLVDKLRVPLIISEHWSGYLPEDGNYKGRIMQNFTRRAVARASHVTAVSEKMIEAMRGHGLNNTYSLLPNVVDTALFAPAEKTQPGPGLRLLHVSMLVDREKNISGLLRVMQKLKEHTDIVLDIVGEGPERSGFERMAKQAGVFSQTVFFHGYHDAEGVAEFMQKADALVLFSHFEGMPVTIIEAQSCGLPVIATRTGSIPTMVSEEQGILVSCGDEQALAEAIMQMKKRKNDFSREAIRHFAESRYSMDSVGRQLNDLYQNILGKFGR